MVESETERKRGHSRGRPPGIPESVRNKRVVTLVTKGEYDKLTQAAAENEKSVSAMVHQIISRYLKRRR